MLVSSSYNFKDGPVILEETCKIDRAPDGNILSPAHHYNKSTLIGMEVDQIMVGTGYMGWKEAMSSTAFKKTAMRYTEKLIEYMKPMGKSPPPCRPPPTACFLYVRSARCTLPVSPSAVFLL